MKPEYKKAYVVRNEEIAKGIYKLSVDNIHGEHWSNVKPGQFYMLRCWDREPLLSRPVSLYEINEREITFLYAVFGRGTKLIGKLKVGDSLELLGPLGNGFEVDKINGRVAVVAGGIGIAPMMQLVKELTHCSVDLYAGFRNEVYAVEDMGEWIKEVHIATEDGSRGHRGFVTDLLEPSLYDYVLCCGPEVMMQKVAVMCIDKKVPVYVSMEKHMACGVGACLVCTCDTKDGRKRACKEGPVFKGDALIL
jgi:dihydroorotate dehydrogenase electron transfer subunit